MKRIISYLFFSFCFLLSSAQLPETVLWDKNQLDYSRQQIRSGNQDYLKLYRKLLGDADKCLTEGPYTVTTKKKMPPSGNKHDYMSMGPYWWPNPNTSDGLPYIRKDGQRNPERHLFEDRDHIGKLMGHVETLSLAYFFSDDEKYAGHASELLRVWFLDPETRMNPNLNYGQCIPGITDGRAEGLIETSGFIQMLDGVHLLDGSRYWTARDNRELKEWFAAFLDWMLTSPIGIDEARAKNNHGTWYDAQAVAIALYTGQKDKAVQIVRTNSYDRLKSQIMNDGSQPRELSRTASWSYSNMNLRAFFNLATLSRHSGQDLWHEKNDRGQVYFRLALDYLIPAFKDTSVWSSQQINGFDRTNMMYLLQRAAAEYQDTTYSGLLDTYRTIVPVHYKNVLLWPGPGTGSRTPNDTLAGIIVNSKGKALKNITVSLRGKETVRTNRKGLFIFEGISLYDTLSVVLPDNQRYYVPLSGMRFLKIRITGQQYSVSEAKDEIIDIGYGSMQGRKNLSGNIVISGEELKATGQSDILQALTGRVPGLNIVYAGDGRRTVTIRGGTSVTADNTPLYIIDDVIVDDLSYLNINDIQQVTIMKEGSIYGVRGANGVIKVKTK